MDEERMRLSAGQCFVFPPVLWHWCLGQPAHKKFFPLIPGGFLPEEVEDPMGNRLTKVHIEKWPLNGSSSSNSGSSNTVNTTHLLYYSLLKLHTKNRCDVCIFTCELSCFDHYGHVFQHVCVSNGDRCIQWQHSTLPGNQLWRCGCFHWLSLQSPGVDQHCQKGPPCTSVTWQR